MPQPDNQRRSSLRSCGGQPVATWPWIGRAAAVLLLVAASSIAYLNADHEELFFDSVLLSEKPEIQTVHDSLLGFWRNALRPGEELTYITFALNYALNRSLGLPGLDVTGFLVVNVCIHALNSCLVYLLLRALLRLVEPEAPPRLGLPLAVAVLFAVHPLHAASVVYIIQRRGLMAVTFYLAALLAYLRFRGAQRPGVRVISLAVVILCYWLSFKSKSMGLTLPLAILAMEFCLRAPDRQAAKRFLFWLAPGALLCVVCMFLFLWTQNLFELRGFRIRPLSQSELWGPWPHFLTESRVFLNYWKLLLLPLPQWLCIDHGFDISDGLLQHGAWAAVLLQGLLIGAAVVAAVKRCTIGAFGILLFYIALIPWAVLPQYELYVEYKTYLSAVGFVLVLAELLRRLPARFVLPGLALAAAILLTVTIHRNKVYESPLALWSDAVAKYPRHARAQANLAATLLKQKGSLEEAVRHGREAVRLRPGFVEARNTLGVSLAELGRIDEAMQEYRATLQLDPNSVDAHYNLGNALQSLKRFPEAIGEYEQAKALAPKRLQVHIMLANVFHEQGRFEEAIRELHDGLRMARRDEDPAELARAHFNMANAYAKTGRLEAAVEEYRTAVQYDPRHANAYYGLGLVLQRQGKAEEAIKAYSDALAVKPDHAAALSALQTIGANVNPPQPAASQP
ncbi:MAG TPA: tetratricopeptide repeat protein [Phycisphaerae bacterium]|nr:tetratricopeptide repeat protein [Phycisphaerae bacterium]